MILLDFRTWEFSTQKKYVPNAQKELLKKDFQTLSQLYDFSILKTDTVTSLSDLFVKNKTTVAVSSVKKITQFYKTLDAVLELENKEVMDYTEAAEEEVYFYGSNSLVAHHAAEIGICGVNKHSDESLFEEYCEDFELNPFSFDIPEGMLTSNVALFVNNKLCFCLEYIKDKKQKKQLISLLKNSNIELIPFSKEQVAQHVFNAKVLDDGRLIILQSTYDVFTDQQKESLADEEVIRLKLPFLEEANIKFHQLLF